MKLTKLILAGTLGLSSLSAFANWQPYIGVGVGALNGSFNTNVNTPPLYINYYNNPPDTFTDTNSGPYNLSNTSNRLSPGFQIGIANQYNKTYLGFEASFWYNDNAYTTNMLSDRILSSGVLFGTVGNQVVSTVNWNTSLTTELGYFVTPRVMPFVKVGLAAAKATVTYNFDDLPDSLNPGQGNLFYTRTNPWLLGPTASIGTQYTFTDHLRGFAELNYEILWNSGSTSPQPTLGPRAAALGINSATPFAQQYTFSSWNFELGTNYYF